MASFIAGLLLGLSLIVAIGAQNAFVLRQGLRRQHVFWVCSVCAASDGILIAAGVAGFGTLAAGLPWLLPIMRYGGAAFLAGYGLRAFYSAWRAPGALSPLDGQTTRLGRTLLTAAAFTWFNPHVYLDTLLLLGSISTHYAGHKIAFATGAASSSVLFFFSLGYGARWLQPFFAKPASWRVLDFFIGCVMATVAVGLTR